MLLVGLSVSVLLFTFCVSEFIVVRFRYPSGHLFGRLRVFSLCIMSICIFFSFCFRWQDCVFNTQVPGQ